MEWRKHLVGFLTVVATLLTSTVDAVSLVHKPEVCQYDPGHGEQVVTRRLIARSGCSTFYQSTHADDWESSVPESCPEGTSFDLESCDCADPETAKCPFEVSSQWIDPEHRPHFPGTEEDDSSNAAVPVRELGLIIGLVVGLALPVMAGIVAAIVVMRQRGRQQSSPGHRQRRGGGIPQGTAQKDTQPMLQDVGGRGPGGR